jgi:hypothetical protein
MSAKRALLVVLVASAVTLAAGMGFWFAGSARALPPAQEPNSPGVTIPYPGRLSLASPRDALQSDEAGQPVADGAYDFAFALYDAPTGGEPLWTETQEDVMIKGGAFVVMLGSANGFPKEVLDGKERWLEVTVRGPGEADFITLTPRQRLTAASRAAPVSPANGQACPHDHFGETWTGSGSVGLKIQNTWSSGVGIEAECSSANASVQGINGSNGPGVFGSGESIGVYGASSSGDAVYGHSGSGHGVYGQSDSGAGVYAEGRNAVVGISPSPGYAAIFGRNDATTGSTYGIWGEAKSYNGYGGNFKNTAGGGVRTESEGIGVTVYSAGSYGVWVREADDIGVWADTTIPNGNYGLCTPDNLYSNNYHLLGAVMHIMQNGGTEPLESGDLVVFSGLAAPLEKDGAPVIRVAKATSADSTAVAGVVFSRYDIEALPRDTEQGQDTTSHASREFTPAGPVLPDEYLLVVVQGPAQVKASTLAGPIQPGDLLSSASRAGHAAKAAQASFGDVSIALPGTVLGKALEPLDAARRNGLLWVWVTLQ